MAACAGVNFLIVALLSLMLGFQCHFAGWRGRARWLVAAAAGAYFVTLLVNALRITLSVALAHLAARTFGLTFQSVHRLLGIVIYLAALGVICLTVQHCGQALPPRKVGHTAAPGLPGKGHLLLLALGCYAGMTLVIPLLHWAYRTRSIWSHAAPVSVLVGGLPALVFAAKGRTWDDGRHEFRSSEHPQPEPVAHQSAARG